ncbi:MAG: lysine--tRNA ligase [Xanthomonadaceae bacterium]|nr:lysine--tRNA ligase [Rhodospirillaceae bacterium]NIA17623.1 lysine--tRNA ligase [Xanthomonadaceae bacterium]
MIKINEKQDRIKKLENLKKLGIDPYPAKCQRQYRIIEIIDNFSKFEKQKNNFFIVGRLRSIRQHGNLAFANLDDGSEEIQIAISKKKIGADNYKIFIKNIDVGDFIQIKGSVFITHKGEKSILVSKFKILSKAILPLPDKWSGFKNKEEQLRKRYLDILMNPKTKEIFKKKAIFWKTIREFLTEQNFLEVETPVLETATGGADAKPFITHHNALDMDVYLRISGGELWQKRLMIAGYEKTFEIGRIFRNEGMDSEHLQDYTQMEFYWAYADYQDGMKLVEKMYKNIAKKTFHTLKFKINNFDIDLGKKWEIYDYLKIVKKETGIDVSKTNIEEIEAKLKELKVKYDKKGFNMNRAIDNLWKYCRKKIKGPGFLIGLPLEVSPLAKKNINNPKITQRFQPIIAGSELGNGYSELNDPLDQARRFKQQAKLREAGDEEAQMNDEEFVIALEYGMPPSCGFGFSERLFSFFMDKSVRECQIFPLMKPK